MSANSNLSSTTAWIICHSVKKCKRCADHKVINYIWVEQYAYFIDTFASTWPKLSVQESSSVYNQSITARQPMRIPVHESRRLFKSITKMRISWTNKSINYRLTVMSCYLKQNKNLDAFNVNIEEKRFSINYPGECFLQHPPQCLPSLQLPPPHKQFW